MNLLELREMNIKRCEESYHSLNRWNSMEWACAMAGEAGEACNAIKKLRRLVDDMAQEDDPTTYAEAKQAVAKELADTLIYLDLTAARLGIDLAQATVDKFNETSDKIGSPHKLRPPITMITLPSAAEHTVPYKMMPCTAILQCSMCRKEGKKYNSCEDVNLTYVEKEKWLCEPHFKELYEQRPTPPKDENDDR